MKNIPVNTFIVIISLLLLPIEHACAFDLDMTVDDEIRTNYNSSKLVKDTNTDNTEILPDLPDKLKNEDKRPNNNGSNASKINNQDNITKITDLNAGTVKIHKGMIFHVTNNTKISDWQQKGTTIKFKLRTPVIKKNYNIPTGTIFTGEIIESHQPQVSCNGGLVVVRVHSMNYKGQTVPLNAYITRADNKFVFLNNIKGDRTYLKTTWQKGAWGRNMFHRMCSLTSKLGADGATLILAPFPFVYGVLCAGGNAVVSPICAFFSKGGHVSIPAGSNFNIRLLDNSYID